MHEFLAVIGFVLLLLTGLMLVACSGGGRESEPERQTTSAERAETDGEGTGLRYREVEVVEGGILAGNVRWVGELPQVPRIPVQAHRELCGESQPSPALRVGSRRGVADAVVSLVHIAAGRPIERPEAPPIFARRGCRYLPHVLGVLRGTHVRFVNEDPVLHNVRGAYDIRGTIGDTRWINIGLPNRGDAAEREVPRSGTYRITNAADAPWMLGWIHAFEHPYFAITDESGHFEIHDIPEGQYDLQVWHEGFRLAGGSPAEGSPAGGGARVTEDNGSPAYSNPVVLTRPVSVITRERHVVDFELSARAAEAAGH